MRMTAGKRNGNLRLLKPERFYDSAVAAAREPTATERSAVRQEPNESLFEALARALRVCPAELRACMAGGCTDGISTCSSQGINLFASGLTGNSDNTASQSPRKGHDPFSAPDRPMIGPNVQCRPIPSVADRPHPRQGVWKRSSTGEKIRRATATDADVLWPGALARCGR